MKKIKSFLITILISFFLTLSCFAADLPAPFQKIKEAALRCEKDADGDHISKKTLPNGVIFHIAHIPGEDVTGLSRGDRRASIAVLWNGKYQQFEILIFSMGMVVKNEIISKEQACQEAYRILREMVEGKIF